MLYKLKKLSICSSLCLALIVLVVDISLADDFARISSTNKQASVREKFSSRTELSVKGGNHRSIFRPGLLVPLYQDNTSLLHASTFLMLDNTKSIEGNFGIGYRKRLGVQAFGVYGFYDIRRTSNRNIVHQATLGLEYLRSHMEFRSNVYLPSTKKFILDSLPKQSYQKADGHKRIALRASGSEIFEQALRGFDIELGGQFPGLESLSTRVAYYHFGFSSDKMVKIKHGIRFSISYSIMNALSVDGEYSYATNSNANKKDKHTLFGGLTFSYNFGKTKPFHQTLLERKMNSLPVRDIDVVVGQGSDIWHSQVVTPELANDSVVLVLDSETGLVRMLRLVDDELAEITISEEDDSSAIEVSNLLAKHPHLLQSKGVHVFTTDGRGFTILSSDGVEGDVHTLDSELDLRNARDGAKEILANRGINRALKTSIELQEQAAVNLVEQTVLEIQKIQSQEQQIQKTVDAINNGTFDKAEIEIEAENAEQIQMTDRNGMTHMFDKEGVESIKNRAEEDITNLIGAYQSYMKEGERVMIQHRSFGRLAVGTGECFIPEDIKGMQRQRKSIRKNIINRIEYLFVAQTAISSYEERINNPRVSLVDVERQNLLSLQAKKIDELKKVKLALAGLTDSASSAIRSQLEDRLNAI